ncbi:MAG: hypothetical protein K2Q14_08910, partial [Gammaproteobacteria bacterium]|nr:hypothetical protein [Gammaproteobacteria bacterium]
VDAGNANGAYDIGLVYYNGDPGVPQDLVKAYAWFATADALQPNDKDTLQMKSEVYSMLPPADQASAKTLAQQYISQYVKAQN